MALSFRSDPLSVTTVFNDFYQIPHYQRDYEWGIDEIDDLWNDIANAIENQTDHFLGAIVLKGEKGKDTIFEVMDGQQRLITLTILLASIRDNLDALGDTKLAVGTQTRISHIDTDGNPKSKVTLNRSAGPFMCNLIQKHKKSEILPVPQSEEEKKIKKAFEYFNKKISEKLNNLNDTSSKLSFLKQLKDKIEEIYLIAIYVKTEDDAYTIFEVLNDRGLELSVADLLKNVIFKKYDKNSIKDAEDVWRKMIHLFESRKINFTKFLRHYWISKYKLVTTPELFKDIKKEIHGYDSDKINKFLAEIDTESKNYTSLYSPDQNDFNEFSQKKKDVIQTLSNIKIFDVKQCYTLLLALYRALFSKKLNNQQFLKIVQLVEDFTFVYIVVLKGRTSSLEEKFSSNALKIKHPNFEFNKWLRELKSEFNELIGDFNRFYDELENITYISHKPSLIKYILAKIEFAGQNNMFNIYNASIEHIYPENGNGKDWPIMDAVEKQQNYLVHNIGNLTLLHPDDNEILSTDKYIIKSKLYSNCKASITSAIPKDYPNEWNKNTISDRRNKLIEFIKEKGIWRI